MDQTEIPDIVKHSLLDLRNRLGLSQKEASKRLGVSIDTLRNWESDSSNITYKQIQKIATTYKIPESYIFFGSKYAFSGFLNKSL